MTDGMRPSRSRHSEHLCPMFQRAMDVLGKPWNGHLLATLAEGGTLRFGELRQRLTTMGDRMLALRLRELEARGLIERRVQPGPPVRVDYALTETGQGFVAVAVAIGTWGSRIRPLEDEDPVPGEVQA